MKNAVFISNCNASISESLMSNAGMSGLVLNTGSTYSIQNCAMVANGTGVTFGSASGVFAFNTVTNNKGMTGVSCAAAAIIADSIVFNNKTGGNTQFTGASCVLSNVVVGAGDTYSGPGTKILLDPAFVGASDPHLDLTAGAALTKNQACCIDKINGPGPTPSPSPLPTVDI